jgi:DNA-binding MarR family transcriptional regulator
MAHFPRLFQYFASPGNTRYEWDRTGPISAINALRVKRPALVRSFRLQRSFCNIKPKYVNMADINVTSKGSGASSSLADPSAPGTEPKTPLEPIWDIIELLFFAYRDFVGDPDEVLLKLSFGRAHHRVLHFVNRNPGMKVADLLETLNITKQSLGRVLKQLVDQGYVVQKEGAQDRRQRLLYVTTRGETLALKLANLQTQRINRAFGELGPNAHEAARRFLTSMIDTDNREGVLRLIARADRASKIRD